MFPRRRMIRAAGIIPAPVTIRPFPTFLIDNGPNGGPSLAGSSRGSYREKCAPLPAEYPAPTPNENPRNPATKGAPTMERYLDAHQGVVPMFATALFAVAAAARFLSRRR